MNHSYPLVLQACMDDLFGSRMIYDGGAVYDAAFIYLDGSVNAALLDDVEARWKYRLFVCLSPEWETALPAKYPALYPLTRYQMTLDIRSINTCHLEEMIQRIPAGYSVSAFDDRAYNAHPFQHGVNYKSYEEFRQTGVGAVIWREDTIVSSASSFLTYHNAVELDISTLPEHRRKGLGQACAAHMLLACKERNMPVHWDAQNIASMRMAEKLRYRLDHEYTVYGFFPLEDV